MAAAVVGLLAGYSLKAQCLNPRVWNGFQFRHSCYTDIIPLYTGRNLNARRFPYLDSTPASRANRTDVEYPVGTGLYMGDVALTVSTTNSFFNANAIGLAIMGILTTICLAGMASDKRRVLLFALGPAVVLYAFHNWDLLAVGPMAVALYLYWRGWHGWSGFALGIAAATKLFPAFILPALLIGAWKRSRKLPWSLAAAFVAGAAILNLPVMAVNFAGWKYPWDFQGSRTANFETWAFMLFRHLGPEHGKWFFDSNFVNLVSGAAFVVGATVMLGVELMRTRARPYALSFALLLWFLVTAKVFSPQYALWVLPFFALLRMPWWSYVAFAVTDAAVWFAVSGYFLGGSANHRLWILEITVWARYAVLLGLIALSFFVDELVADPPTAAEPAPVPLTA